MLKKRIAMVCAISALAAIPMACSAEKVEKVNVALVNGGFESGDLSGWTIEYGDAFDNDCVMSDKTFTFAGDPNGNRIAVGATGNWYLSGKSFTGTYAGTRTGAIRSSEFIMPKDGVISMKLAGGAPTIGKGGATKPAGKQCFVGIYRSSDDRMLARVTNKYFVEHTENYVPAQQYANGALHTDNFKEYSVIVDGNAGEKCYVRIVDNDDSWYYGYIAVDDIRIGSSAKEQATGTFFVKTKNYVKDVDAAEHEIKNGGFETGSLAGWTIVSGDAFSNDGVNAESTWWNEGITYSRDGDYHYGKYRPEATGIMRSSEFVLGGSGYVSWKIGGCSNNLTTYLRFMQKAETPGAQDVEIARFSNFMYRNWQFPYVANGMRLLNLVRYYSDLSRYIGKTLYIEAVDQNASSDELGCMTLDSIKTYYQDKPVWNDGEAYFAEVVAQEDEDLPEDSEYQVLNGGFETGDLTDWTLANTTPKIAMGGVTSDAGWGENNYPYNKRGDYCFSGIDRIENEKQVAYKAGKGTLTSSPFTVGGIGWMTFKFGGGKNSEKCYISVYSADGSNELYRYDNYEFADKGESLINRGTNLGNMVLYKADLSKFMGQSVKIVITDNDDEDWGLVTVDSFRTYYETAEELPRKAVLAIDMLAVKVLGDDDEYQVLNGDFETGTLRGWTMVGNIGGISSEKIWWAECIMFNKDKKFFFSGWKGREQDTGTLTSSPFTVGGIGWMTFKLGGGKNEKCYVEIIDAQTDEVLARYANKKFLDVNFDKIKGEHGTAANPVDASKYGAYLANMALYKADLTRFMGRNVRIRVVDTAKDDWGLFFADSFITHYVSNEQIDETATLAEDIK